MYKLILVTILFSLNALATNASATAGFSEVLNGCNQLTHAEWIKRYNAVEGKVIETLEKNPKLSQATEKELLEVVFPQDLPKSHPMKGAFVGCFEHFNDYHKAKNNVESLKALKRMESCYRDAYKIDPPKVLGQYMECLKKVKY
jgi:hypothetical protein